MVIHLVCNLILILVSYVIVVVPNVDAIAVVNYNSIVTKTNRIVKGVKIWAGIVIGHNRSKGMKTGEAENFQISGNIEDTLIRFSYSLPAYYCLKLLIEKFFDPTLDFRVGVEEDRKLEKFIFPQLCKWESDGFHRHI